jgi:hypothetical protein
VKNTVLREKVITAFMGVEYPGDEFVRADTSDDSLFALANLLGKHWQGLSNAHLAPSHDEALGALSEKGFRYYLPGLLLLCLDEPEASTQLPNAIVDRFTAGKYHDQESITRKERRIAILSRRQRLVVSAFFRYLKTVDEHCPELLADAERNVIDGTIRITRTETISRWADSRMSNLPNKSS